MYFDETLCVCKAHHMTFLGTLVNDTRVNDFGMVEIKHESRYLDNNLLFAHQVQQMYYLSYPHKIMKIGGVVYKVNSEMDTHRYDKYVERHEDDDVYVYQE
jgi:hypothetical protein